MSQIRMISGHRDNPPLEKGFSLIELLIVVAVILIVAAIAIPNYIQSKMRANEAAAVHTLRDISTAELFYSSTYGINYITTLLNFPAMASTPIPNNAGLIDSVVASGIKQGYAFNYTPVATDSLGHTVTFTLTADPISTWSDRTTPLLYGPDGRDSLQYLDHCRSDGSSAYRLICAGWYNRIDCPLVFRFFLLYFSGESNR